MGLCPAGRRFEVTKAFLLDASKPQHFDDAESRMGLGALASSIR